MTRRSVLIAASGLVAWRGRGFAEGNSPKQILVIRHGEKTELKTDIDLNPRGFARAAALPRLFPGQFDTPDFIFAARASKHSNRPVETVTPLSKTLHLKIDTRFGEDDFRSLAHELLSKPIYVGKTVPVCWHHGRIPNVAQALGVPHPPAHWSDKQFDRVWKIQFDGDVATLTSLPQHLLEGDSTQ